VRNAIITQRQRIMDDLVAIILTVVVAVLAMLLWRLVRAIERGEARIDVILPDG
jgi:hypothetical protein